ncbi:MAG: ATP-binding protein [Candidatus Binatia bacterium]
MGIWSRLALAIALGFIIFFTIFSLLSMRMVRDSTNRILNERQVLTQMAANEIDALLSQAFYELEKATTFAQFDPQAANLEEEYHMLAHTYGRVGAFSLGVYFYDATGKIILVEPYDALLIGTNHSTEPYILQVIESGQRSVSGPFVEPRTGAPVVALTIPIKDEQGQLISMLSGLIDLSSSEVRRPIEQALDLGHTGHAELVDSQGTVIVSSYPGVFLMPGEHVDFYRKMMAGRLVGVETVPYDHSEGENEIMHVMAFVPLSVTDWGIAMGGDATETFAPVIALQNSIFLLGGLMLVVILAATLIGTRRLVHPVKVLTRSAQGIAEGNLTAPIQISEGGEIGLLGYSLEEMRLRLKEYIDEIQRWNVELEERVKERTRELEQMMEEVSRLHAMRELDHLKSEFISSISHELRTPLGFITGYVTTLLRSDVSHSKETRQEFLQIIKEESEKLTELVENFLDTSQIQAGSFAVEKRPTNLVELAQKVVEKVRSIADRHSFLLHFEPSLPSVPGDSRRLEQVLHNLLDNAIKYSPQGSQIAIIGEMNDDHVLLSVTDEGQGIPRAELGKIFNAFYRISGSDAQKEKGAGLGLTICRAIVEAHGGSIWAENAPGKGNVFCFTLPLQGGA